MFLRVGRSVLGVGGRVLVAAVVVAAVVEVFGVAAVGVSGMCAAVVVGGAAAVAVTATAAALVVGVGDVVVAAVAAAVVAVAVYVCHDDNDDLSTDAIATRPTNKPDLCIPLENLVFRIVFRCEKLVLRVFHLL